MNQYIELKRQSERTADVHSEQHYNSQYLTTIRSRMTLPNSEPAFNKIGVYRRGIFPKIAQHASEISTENKFPDQTSTLGRYLHCGLASHVYK